MNMTKLMLEVLWHLLWAISAVSQNDKASTNLELDQAREILTKMQSRFDEVEKKLGGD